MSVDLEVDPADLLIVPDYEPPEEDDDVNPPRKLSYTKIKAYQAKMHPRDQETKEPFPWWSSELGFMPILDSQVNEAEWVTKEAKELGLGPVLYLYTMKALAYMFLVFTILNIPLFMFYVNGLGP